jgi:hypothetical protein
MIDEKTMAAWEEMARTDMARREKADEILDGLDLIPEKANRVQRMAIRKIFREAVERVTSSDPQTWEKVLVKKFQAHWIGGGRISVVVRLGREDWEGTLASVYCGAYGHFFVGPRGGIESKTAEKGSRKKAKESSAMALIYGWSH